MQIRIQKQISAASSNRLLDMLPRKDRERFVAGCECVDLAFLEKLTVPGATIGHVHFPIGGVGSILPPVPHARPPPGALGGAASMRWLPLPMWVQISPKALTWPESR